MKKQEVIEAFKRGWEECSLGSKIAIHNGYIGECLGTSEDYIEVNDVYFFNTWFEDKPMDAVRACCYGKYEYHDEYVWLNSYGNLDSGTYECQLPFNYYDLDDMADWYIEDKHYKDIDNITEMEEFLSMCEEGNIEDDEEEE